MLRSSASVVNLGSPSDSSNTKVSSVSVCLGIDGASEIYFMDRKGRCLLLLSHRNFLKASSLRLALKSATAAELASFAFSIFVSAYHLCTGSAFTQLFSHSSHSTSVQSEAGRPSRQFLLESNLTLMDLWIIS